MEEKISSTRSCGTKEVVINENVTEVVGNLAKLSSPAIVDAVLGSVSAELKTSL
jgi:hypothetical protein